MSKYVTLTLHTHVYDQIIEALMTYCSNLDSYWDMQDAVHVIDALEEMYNEDMGKQNKESQQWMEYEKLFNEQFKDGNIDNFELDEYRNFHKVNNVLEDYKVGGSLDILDEKQQFFLVLDLINVFTNKEEKQ